MLSIIQILGFTERLGEAFSSLFGGSAWLATILISMIPMIELKGGIVFGRNPDFWGENALGGWQALACGLAGGRNVKHVLTVLLQPVFAWLKKTKVFRRFVLRLEKSFRKKAGRIDASSVQSAQTGAAGAAQAEAAAQGRISAAAQTGAASQSAAADGAQRECGGQARVVAAQGEDVRRARKKTFGKLLGVFLFVAVPLPLTGVWTGTAIAVFLGLKKWQTILAAFAGNTVAGVIILLVSEVFFEYLDIVFYVILGIVLLLVLIGAGKMLADSRREKREGRADGQE